MLMVAFFAAITIARWRARKEGIDPNKITDLGIYVVCAGILGARVFYVIQFPRTMDKTGMVDGSPAFLHQYELGLVHLSDTHALPIHPTQLYSFLSDVVLFFVLIAFFKFRR